MLNIIFSLAAIFILLVVTEGLWRRRKLGDEMTRKAVHISVAVFVAFWPYYMTYSQIKLLALAFLVVIIISRYFHIFKGMMNVKRKTLGDLFFPLSILILAILEPQHILFTIALLNVGLADGIAALVGKKYGKKNTYKVFGQAKSIAGSVSFVLVSFIIIVLAKHFTNENVAGLTWLNVFIVPIVLSVVENISVY